MMMMTKKTAVLLAVLSVFPLVAVAGMREVALELRIEEAPVIVEARVAGSVPVMNRAGTRIETFHTLEVSRVLKAEGHDPEDLGTVDVVTPGGRIGDEWHVVHPSLSLAAGDAGIFFLEDRPRAAGERPVFAPYASAQGFVAYDAGRIRGRDPFREYEDVLRDVHEPIRRLIGEPRLLIPAAAWGVRDALEAAPEGAPAGLNPVITNLNPTEIAAGVQDILTISGSNFGAFAGLAGVFFDSSDDGIGGAFGAVDAEHIVSWSDTTIQVFVPARVGSGFTAGTGAVRVQDSVGSSGTSPMNLTVTYALFENLTGEPAVRRISQENENGLGGYTFLFSTATGNNGVEFTSIPEATDRFLEALDLWNCEVGWNVEAFGTTTVQDTGNDGVNIVAFDHDGDPLPAGVLGRASNWFTTCGGDTWWLNGVDIRFKRDGTSGVNWYYGADPGSQAGDEDDFMSVALHEQGHAVLHGHINDQADVMYYALTRGTNRRTLSMANIDGGLDMVGYSAAYDACGTTGMLALDCDAAPIANFTASPLGTCGDTLMVQFQDLSLSAPTSWLWDLGDSSLSSARNPGHTYNGQGLYSVSLTAANENGSDMLHRGAFIAVTDPPPAASCTPPTAPGYDNCCRVGILNVTLNTIDHDTETNTEGEPVYEDFTCSQFTTLEPGGSYPISVTTGPANDEDVRVYIDWDNDGTLEGGEEVFTSLDVRESHTGMIQVPQNAVHDTPLRMRVLSDLGQANIGSACEELDFGQGEDYSVIVHVPEEPAPAADPQVATAVCGNTVHYAWVRHEDGGTNPNIFYRECTVGGGCGGTIKLVGAATAESNPTVACSGSTVIVMWEDRSSGNVDLAYRRRVDPVMPFGPRTFLVKGSADETAPVLVMSGDTALVVFEDSRNGNQDLAMRRSTNGGADWEPFRFLVRSPHDDTDPVVDLDGDNALLGWVDRRSGNRDIAYRRSTNGGADFLPLTFMVKGPSVEKDPTVSVDGTLMLMAWSDARFGNEDVAFRRSDTTGSSFDSLRFLVRATPDDTEPVIRVSGTEGLLVWVDERSGNKNISYLRSTDGGDTWVGLSRLVNFQGGDEFGPACDLVSSRAGCAWADTRTGTPVPSERRSSNAGASWSPRFELD